MESYPIIMIVIAVSGSAVIKNSVGIGAGVFLLPVLTLVLPPKVALGLGAPAMLISDLVGIKNYWGEWDKRGFVATLVVFFAMINLSKWIAYTQVGILTWDIAIFVWMLSPLIILGGFIGNIINRKLQYPLFQTIVLVLTLIIGCRLFMTA